MALSVMSQNEIKLVKELIYKVNEQIKPGLENPKQVTIHLAFVLQLKGGWGYPERC